VISQNDLSRIRQTVNPMSIAPGHIEKEMLKTLSDERATKWPNTIEAQRARKERARKERLEQEEAERCEVDRQEALIKAENRRLQIERANKMLYDDTDRVKSFHGKLLLSDVIQEREKQILYKQKLGQITKKQEDDFHKSNVKAVELAEEAERRKLEDARKRAFKQRDAQLTQLEELKDRIIKEKLSDKAEGELLKKKAQEAVDLLKQREIERRENEQRMHSETSKANEALQQIKAIELQKEMEEEERIVQFAKRKEQLALERKLREEERRAQKDVKRDRMVRVMEDDLRGRRDQSERRAGVQAEEALQKENRAMEQVEQIRAVERDAIARSRAQQAQIKEMRRQRETADEKSMTLQVAARGAAAVAEEEAERVAQYVRNKNLQEAHIRQMGRKKEKAAFERARENAESEATKLILAEDDELFKQYTAVCMDEWSKDGKTLKPMQIELAKQRANALMGYTAG